MIFGSHQTNERIVGGLSWSAAPSMPTMKPPIRDEAASAM